MILMQGQGVSKGIAKGRLHFIRRADMRVVKSSGRDPAAERARLAQAQAAAVAQLYALAARCLQSGGAEMAALFETHAMLVEDEDYQAYIAEVMAKENCSAEYAVQAAGERFAGMFTGMDDEYLQARSADVRDVTRRILANLMGVAEDCAAPDKPVILAADDLAPSETIQLDRTKLLALVTQGGSCSSHTAILARTLGIPAVCGVGTALRAEYEGRMVCVDGESGQVVLEPDEPTLALLQEKQARQLEYMRVLQTLRGKEDVTLDGRRLSICCNIGSPGEAAAVLENDGHGVGLFRSEFLYLAADDYPDEEAQFAAYRSVAEAMKGKRVVIRTMDIGADKQVDYFHMPREENPALGVRAIRISLKRPELFRTQLRAVYRASAYGRIAVLFPMITAVWEVRACRRACRSVMAELAQEGLPFDSRMEIGVMIETPASVFIARELAREVDFFSVGTNDLTQYILACDRQANGLGEYFDPHHPAVLRALKAAADAAHEAGIWIGICGDLAADTELLPTFLAMGIDELSVPPSAVLPLRAAIRSSRAADSGLDKLEC